MHSSDKANLRQDLISKRPHSSEGLLANLVRIAMETNANLIASYSPTALEPDVSEFNQWVVATGRELVLPRVTNDSLEFARGETVSGAYGLKEPVGQSVDPAQIELVIVPALAADALGYRLGKGKGYYDKVLGKLTCPKFAVIFDGEYFESLPVESHDERVSGVVSPSAINYFSSH